MKNDPLQRQTKREGLSVSPLLLKHANKSRLGTIDWGPNDFDVLNADRCVGRIFMSPASTSDRNWMWTITAPEYPKSIHTRGYSETREQAMRDFKTQWTSESLGKNFVLA